MSYARMNENSDVYVIKNMQGEYQCMGCRIVNGEIFDKPGQMIDHLKLHLVFEDKVPEKTFKRLEQERGTK